MATLYSLLWACFTSIKTNITSPQSYLYNLYMASWVWFLDSWCNILLTPWSLLMLFSSFCFWGWLCQPLAYYWQTLICPLFIFLMVSLLRAFSSKMLGFASFCRNFIFNMLIFFPAGLILALHQGEGEVKQFIYLFCFVSVSCFCNYCMSNFALQCCQNVLAT